VLGVTVRRRWRRRDLRARRVVPRHSAEVVACRDDCAISDAFEVAGRRAEEQKKQRSVVGSRTSPYDTLATSIPCELSQAKQEELQSNQERALPRSITPVACWHGPGMPSGF
jgi:hypothetical protein